MENNLEQQNDDVPNTDAPNHYFVAEAVKHKLNRKKGSKVVVDDAEVVELAGPNFPMAWTGRSEIGIGDMAKCIVNNVYHPGHFNVMLKKHNCEFTNLKTTLFEFFSKHADMERYKFTDDDFKNGLVGLYVAVQFPGEWRRGYIMKTFKAQKTLDLHCQENTMELWCKVLLIDYGDHKNVKLDTVRRIPERFLKRLAAQAIKCCLQFDGNAKSLNVLDGQGSTMDRLWTVKEAEILDELMKDTICILEFVCFEDEQVLPNPIVWKCRVRRYVTENLKETVSDEAQMADMFLNKLIEKEKNQDGASCGDDDGSCELPSLDPWKFLESCSISHLEDSKGINVNKADMPFIFTDEK